MRSPASQPHGPSERPPFTVMSKPGKKADGYTRERERPSVSGAERHQPHRAQHLAMRQELLQVGFVAGGENDGVERLVVAHRGGHRRG